MPVAGSELRIAAHVPGVSGCRGECLYLPHTRCVGGVHVYLQANFKLDQLASSGRAWIQHEVSDRQGSMLVCPGELANKKCMWDKYVNVVFAERPSWTSWQAGDLCGD